MPESAEATPTTAGSKKKGSWLTKNKWYVIGALAGIAVLVFYFVNRSNSNAASAGNTTATTPSTGQTYGTLPVSDYGGGFGGGMPTVDVAAPNVTVRNIIRRGGGGKKKPPVKHQKAPRQVMRQSTVASHTAAHNARSGATRAIPAVAVTAQQSAPARRAR